MAPGSNQKRFSRSKGLRRFSSILATSSPPPPSKKIGGNGGIPSKEEETSAGVSTSYIMPDRTQAREFIRHISNSSTSSSEFSLSVALSPYVGADAAPTNSKAPSQLMKPSVVSITSSTKTFPHGEGFDTSSPPLSPIFARQFISTPTRGRERTSKLLDTPRSGMAGIGANGNARETRAALMAVDSEIFSTGGAPMPEPTASKKPSMISLRAAAQHEQMLRRSIDVVRIDDSLTSAPAASGRAAPSSRASEDLRRLSTMTFMQRDFQTASKSTEPLQSTSTARSAPTSSAGTADPMQRPVASTSNAVKDPISSLANQLARRSKSVNKIIGADVANGWQLMWTLATSESAEPAVPFSATMTAPTVEKLQFSSVPVRAVEPLSHIVAPPQGLIRRASAAEIVPSKDVPASSNSSSSNGAGSKSMERLQANASPILPTHLPRTMAGPNATSFPAPPRSRSTRKADTSSSVSSAGSPFLDSTTKQQQQPLPPHPSLKRQSTSHSIDSMASSSGRTPTLLSTVSTYSVKSAASARRPQLIELALPSVGGAAAAAPQRPPRSAKRMSVAAGWQPKMMMGGAAAGDLPPPMPVSESVALSLPGSSSGGGSSSSKSGLGMQPRRSHVPLTSTPVEEHSLDSLLPHNSGSGGTARKEEEGKGPGEEVGQIGDQTFATAYSSEEEKRRWSGDESRADEESVRSAPFTASAEALDVVRLSASVVQAASLGAGAHEDSYSDLEIVAMTETESGDNSSDSDEDEEEANEAELGDLEQDQTDHDDDDAASEPARRKEAVSSDESKKHTIGGSKGGNTFRPQASDDAAVTSTSAHSLIEVLADDESARIAADAQWEMLTGSRLQGVAARGSFADMHHQHHSHLFGVRKTEVFTTHQRISLHGELVANVEHHQQQQQQQDPQRDQARQAVEMWRRLAESYEMGELSKADAVESAPTPAASVMMEDDLSEAPSRLSPDAEPSRTERISVMETRRVEINWSSTDGPGIVVPSSSAKLLSQLMSSTQVSQRTTTQVAYGSTDANGPQAADASAHHLQSWRKDQAELGTPSPPEMDFEHEGSESDMSMFDTPVPGGFLPRFSPVTAALPAASKQQQDSPGQISFLGSDEPSYDETRHGLGLIFPANDADVTPPSSHGHKSDERSWDDDGADVDQKAETSTSAAPRQNTAFSVADSASVAASDCFESADEGSEADWSSRRHSKASRCSRTLEASASLSDASTAAAQEMRTPEESEYSRRTQVAERHAVPQPCTAQTPSDTSALQPKTTNPSPKATVADRISTGALHQCAHVEAPEAESLQNTMRVMAGGADELPSLSRTGYADYPAAAMKRRSLQAAMYNSLRQTPTIQEQAFDAALLDDESESFAREQEASQTQPIPQKPWAAVSPELDGGASSEPEADRLAQLRILKSNRRRDHPGAAAIRNSVIVEEPNEAEVLSARRASKRMSKLGLIDMTSARTVEKSKSITARQRQRLTASMTSTPIMLAEPPSHISWRSKLSASDFQELLNEWGPLEMHRQEVLWELCETERSFIQAICSVQKIFALPLRTPEGRWIKGVPCTVARLFDWLQDIFQLHCKIHSVLQHARHQQSPVLINVAERLLRYIPKLEVHQPFLVRFESVMQTIEEMLRSENSVFGQFIKMQMQIPECKSMTFASLLLKPVQRLMKYPLFFKQLAELTPSTHPDHHATQALLQSTDQVIRDMNDVKAREEDYRDLKALQARIKGLPEGFHLADRERRLLRQGGLTSVQLTPREKIQLGVSLTLSDIQNAAPHSLPNSPLMGNSSRAFGTGGGTTAGTVVDSEYQQGGTTLSAASVGTSSEWDSCGPVMPLVNGRPSSFVSLTSTRSESSASLGLGLGSGSGGGVPRDPLERLTATNKAPTRKNSMASILLRKDKQKDKETALHAFVFSDLVVLATAEDGPGKKSGSRKSKSFATAPQSNYELIERVGLARIVKVTDHSGKCAERPHLLELEVLPLKVDASYSSGFEKRNVSSGPTTLFLSFSNAGSDGTSSSKTPEAESALWYRALERSFLSSLRSRKRNSLMYASKRESLTSLASSGNRAQVQTAHADWARREKQVTDLVMAAARAGDAENLASLIQAGLPFPKSPSQQDLALFAGEELRVTHLKLYGKDSELSGPTGEAPHIPVVGFGILDEAEEEREERRWWALRLSEVRLAAVAEREIDAMVKQLRSDVSTSSSSSSGGATSVGYSARPDSFLLHHHHHHPHHAGTARHHPLMLMGGAASGSVMSAPRRKVRQGLPVLRSGVGSDFTASSAADSSGSGGAVSSIGSSDFRSY